MLKKKITAWTYFNRSVKNLNFQYLYFISDTNKILLLVDQEFAYNEFIEIFWNSLKFIGFVMSNKTATFTS